MLTAGNRTQTWDPDNRLDTVTVTASGATVMSYDYTGMRVKKNSPSGITLYPFSGYQIDPSGTIIKYIRAGTENIASKKSRGEKPFYHNDHLGGVNITTDGAGFMAQIIEYDPWGKVSPGIPGTQY